VLRVWKAAVDWAHRVRLLRHGARCSEAGRTSGAEVAQAVEAPACTVSRACWWARQRCVAAGDAGDLVADGSRLSAGGGKEAC
jgi:hypothetical protein